MYHVVGGGPVGLWVAGKLGREAVLHEEHAEIGRPEHCTGLVSNRLETIVRVPEELKLNRVAGAKFFSRNGSFTLTRGRTEANVIDRAGFDKYLSELAESAGAEILKGRNANPFRFPRNRTVFVAEGVSSRTTRALGGKMETLPAVQYVIRTRERLDSGFVELHFLRSEFFAWVVPESGHLAKVGVAAGEKPKELLDLFLKRRFFGSGFRTICRQGSHVVVGGPVKKTVHGNLVLVGDCAGQVKATTGGGIVTGLICAGIAAENAGNPLKYECEWRRKVGGELEAARLVRKVLSRLSAEEYDGLIGFAKRNSSALRRSGDMDFHSKTLLEIFSKPLNWGFLLKYLGKLFLHG
ncbi:MAG: NAD(P)/FAD-dependent oxidoreductase [archaeon]